MSRRLKRRVDAPPKEEHMCDPPSSHIRRSRKHKVSSNIGPRIANEWSSDTHKSKKRYVPPPVPKINYDLTLCKFWSTQGYCKQFPKCKFQHNLRLVSRLPRAHDRGIYSVTSFPSTLSEAESLDLGFSKPVNVIEIFTGSRDKTVKKWIMYPRKESDPEKMEIKLQKTYNLSSSCLSLYAGYGCLVCGLSNGSIYVVDLACNHEFILKSHNDEIHCVQIIQNILVSADWSGNLKFWKPEIDKKIFVETASIELHTAITSFIEINTATSKQLWVGCSGGIKIVDLTSLSVVKELKVPTFMNQSTPVVMDLLLVEQHVICCLLEGRIIVYNINDMSEVTIDKTKYMTDTQNKKICTMTGSSSVDGPVLICGRPNGLFSILSLPSFEEKLQIKQHATDVRAVHNIGGHPSYFITTAFDGTLAVWFWNKLEAKPD